MGRQSTEKVKDCKVHVVEALSDLAYTLRQATPRGAPTKVSITIEGGEGAKPETFRYEIENLTELLDILDLNRDA